MNNCLYVCMFRSILFESITIPSFCHLIHKLSTLMKACIRWVPFYVIFVTDLLAFTFISVFDFSIIRCYSVGGSRAARDNVV